MAERPSSVVPGIALVVFAILVLFWAAELAYISRAFLSGGAQSAWSWLIHITPRASIFTDPPAHEIWIQQAILGLLTLISGYVSRRLWFPPLILRRNEAKKA